MVKKLKNSNKQNSLFKKDIPKMPEGYYSGDKPNPNLRDFVEQHAKPYDPVSDTYDIESAFTMPLKVEKRKTPITDLHIYWSKKPPRGYPSVIGRYLRNL